VGSLSSEGVCGRGRNMVQGRERGGREVLGVADLFQGVIRGFQGLAGNLQGG